MRTKKLLVLFQRFLITSNRDDEEGSSNSEYALTTISDVTLKNTSFDIEIQFLTAETEK